MKKLILVGATILFALPLNAMEAPKRVPSQRIVHQPKELTVILKTKDGAITLSPEQVNQLPTIKNIVEDVAGGPERYAQAGEAISQKKLVLPVPYKSAPVITLLNLAKMIEQTGDQFKRPDGQYIAQKIQPLFDRLEDKKLSDLIQLLIVASYFYTPNYMLNGIVRVFVQKELKAHPAISVEALEKKINIAYLNQFIESQYPLVKDNIPELSIADHMALYAIWEGDPSSLNLSGFGITSLEGLEKVPHIDFVKEINLSRNKLASIGPNAFKRFTNLQKINLMLNPKISTINEHAFDGLSALKTLTLGSTTLKNLNMTKQQLQQYYFPNNQQIQIAVYPDSLAADVQ